MLSHFRLVATALILSALLSLSLPGSGQTAGTGKTLSWELCTEPWLVDTGIFNTTIGITGYSPDQSSTIVVKLFPCPYVSGANQVGLWTQTCTYNIYGFAYEAKRPKTTCLNELVIYGQVISADKPQPSTSTLTWQNDVDITYNPKAGGRMLDDGVKRALARSNLKDWWPPSGLAYSNTRWTSGTGKLSKPYAVMRDISLQSESQIDFKRVQFEWKVKMTVTYKKPYLNYPELA